MARKLTQKDGTQRYERNSIPSESYDALNNDTLFKAYVGDGISSSVKIIKNFICLKRNFIIWFFQLFGVLLLLTVTLIAAVAATVATIVSGGPVALCVGGIVICLGVALVLGIMEWNVLDVYYERYKNDKDYKG